MIIAQPAHPGRSRERPPLVYAKETTLSKLQCAPHNRHGFCEDNAMAHAKAPDSPVDRMGRMGFRKWYERELLSGHAHMVLSVLSVIALMASMEGFRDGPTVHLENVLFVVVCGAIGLWALRRYLFLMMRAEVVANQANCPNCGEYGRFGVVARNGGAEAEACCRKCVHKWVIDTQT